MAELPLERLGRGERWRAPYAEDPIASRGRSFAEAEDPMRSPFQRDRDRVIHCNAFRRLKHKTQVFIHQEDDHFRTRLSHSLEVAQIARSIARPLGLDEDLTEALALAHDLGHPPFGHAGERALDTALAAFGGFDHNAQTLRVVTALERRYPLFDGLNLTWETLEGLAKHNGPLIGVSDRSDGAGWPDGLRDIGRRMDLQLDTFPSLEAQTAAISDDIAYDSHDLGDGLRAGLLGLGELADQPLAGPILARIDAEHPGLDPARRSHELVRLLIKTLIADVVTTTWTTLQTIAIRTADQARRAGRPLVVFSGEIASAEAELKRFLFERLYRHDAVMRTVRGAEAVVGELFEAFSADPTLMPDDWARGLERRDPFRTARRVADYVAGMTDRYAISEHERLFDATPDLR